MATHWLSRYIAEVGKTTAAGGATELSYRTPIENMLKEAVAEFRTSVDIVHEPGRTKNIGAPDFLISAKGGGVVGYVECKKPDADLQSKDIRAQVEKYRTLSENIMLTDSLRWLHFRDGEKVAEVELTTKPDKRKREKFIAVLQRFMMTPAEKVSDSKRLAQALAKRCTILRDILITHEDDEQSRLNGMLKDFRNTLDSDLDFARFADIFAQTLIYSLLMAKLNPPDGEQLTLATVHQRIPENFAVIRDIAAFLTELNDRKYKDISGIVKDILAIINGMNKVAIAETISRKKSAGKYEDPYQNFYETFLAEYDPKLRKSRGVYYTPLSVVKFIVNATDDLLRRDFNMSGGFANKQVTALDFAAGTGNFMLEMASLILEGKSPGMRDVLAREHFLKNFHGFEFMASAYVISHLKLSRFLESRKVSLRDEERIRVYLTNTLEKGNEPELTQIFSLKSETKDAKEIKDKPVLVIVGNPPYSAVSQNKSDEQYEREHKKIKGKRVKDIRHTWIGGLLRGIEDGKKIGGSYYEVGGKPLGESNPKALQDDYVKFIRFAQHKMDQVPKGIIAIITNHSFLDNPTFRGMRQSLMKTFDALYFLDLHGNSKKKEKTPDGSKDENVFDIQQGVAISLLVKNPAVKKKGVFHADMWGSRDGKNSACEEGAVNWTAIKPAAPHYFFVPYDNKGDNKFRQHWSVSEIFSLFSNGIKSHRDHFAFGFSADEIKSRIGDLANENLSVDVLREKYNLPDTRDWLLQHSRNALIRNHSFDDFLKMCLYYPFDARWCYYGAETMELHRPNVMRHMLAGDNLALLTPRITKDNFSCFCTNFVATHKSAVRYDTTNFFPLYYDAHNAGKTIRTENFNPKFRQWINKRYKGKVHSAKDIFGCIYAVLHSPNYCGRYAEFLRRDFPRIPFPESNDEFKRYAAIGNELIAAHLLHANCNGKYGELCGDGTSRKVENVRYNENGGHLYFNKNEYFAPLPPEVFNFQIGGYKPLDRYLKSRKGRKLSLEEITNFQQAANAIAFTIAKMHEIDNPPKQ